jgi:O-antigen ligase
VSLRRAAGQALLLFHLVLSPVAFGYATAEIFEHNKVALLLLVALSLLALGTLGLRPRREPVALGFLLFSGSALVSTVTSLSPWSSLTGHPESPAGLPVLLAGTVLFFATRALCATPDEARRLLAAPVLGAAVAATYATLQLLGLDPIPWVRTASFEGAVRPFATLSHPNFLGAYLAMAFPLVAFFASRAIARRQWLATGGLTLVGLLSLLAIATSLSRGAWLALGAAVLVLLVGAYLLGHRRAVALTGGLGLVLAAGLVGAVLLLREPDGAAAPLLERARQLTESSGRLHIWRAAWHIFLEHPLVGSGLDAFWLAFQRHRTPEYWLLEWNTTPYKAHDGLLHVLATQGLLGAAAALFLAGGLVLAGRRAWKRASAEERPLLLALFAGLAAFYVQGLVSFTVAATGTLFVTFAGLLSRLGGPGTEASPEPSRGLGRSAFALTLAVSGVLALLVFAHNFHGGAPPADSGHSPQHIALLILTASLAATLFSVLWTEWREPEPPTAQPSKSSPRAGSRWLEVGRWAAAAVLAFFLVVRPTLASRASREGDGLLGRSPVQAAGHFERAVALDATRPLYFTKLGTALHLATRSTASPEERKQLLSRAREAFQRALTLVPEDARLHAGLGGLLAELALQGEATAAQVFAAHDGALERDPNNANLYVQAAQSALVLGDVSSAQRYATRAAGLYPHFGPPRAQWGYVTLVTGYPETAVRLLRESLEGEWHGDESGRLVASTNLAAALLTLGRREEALAQYRDILTVQPDHPLALEALRRLEAGSAPLSSPP